MHLLVVEDDDRIASFLAKGLDAEGYTTSSAGDASKAMAMVNALGDDLALVLLDLGLPDADGIVVLASIRKLRPDLPIIVITARHEVSEKVRGLDAGANDYITKPFSFDELLARIRATLRSRDQESSTTLTVDDLTFDLVTKVAIRDGRTIELSPREWKLLELFMRNPQQVLSRIQILNRVWDYGFDPGSNVVDVYVGYLRRKLNFPHLPQLVQTVRGAGYRLVPPRS